MIHPFAARILETAQTELPDGSLVEATSFIPRDECELIYRMVERCRPKSAVEVGTAYGVSTLCIADALAKSSPATDVSGRRLITIDPAQSTGWSSAGVHLLKRASLDSIVLFLEETSQLALPRLVRDGERFGFAFIDGWHTFDHVLVDFFFVDLMLEVGGIIVLDDVGYPAVHRALEFILSNREYELVEALATPEQPTPALRARRALKRRLRPLARTDRDPDARSASLFRLFEDCHAVAIQKKGADTRRFDHFRSF
jgi:predicted O-methyltransferase YrrM